MLSVTLMMEVARRTVGFHPPRCLLDDTMVQAAYCLDAPRQVEDGCEWWQDPLLDPVGGVVPRIIDVRDDSPSAGEEAA